MRRIEVRNRLGQYQWLLVDLGENSLFWVAKSQNDKTGKIPTQFIGASREESESTCRICPLWYKDLCYSQDGSPQMGHISLLRFVRNGGDRSLGQALENADEDAYYVRMAAIGDSGSIHPEVYKKQDAEVREWGFGVLNYTHQWYLPHAAYLKEYALASADTMKDVVDSVAQGWRAAWHVDAKARVFDGKTIGEKPQGTLKNGIKYFYCPAQRTNNAVTCNMCGLCDIKKKTQYDVIIFSEHGQQMKFAKKREELAKSAE